MSRIFDALEHGLAVKSMPTEPAPVLEWLVADSRRTAEAAGRLEADAGRKVEGVGDFESEMVTLYFSIRSSLPDIEHPSILFVGSRSNEGTSTVAREFARTACRQMNKTVLLVDLDRSRPDMNVFGHLRPEKEIDEFFRNGDPIEKCLCRVDGSSLYTMPLYKRTICTAKTIDSVKDNGFWQLLKDKFDLVIVDSPPALMLPDGPAVASHVDGVVLVVEAEKTRWQDAERTKELILDSGGAILGIVFNRQRQYVPPSIYRYL